MARIEAVKIDPNDVKQTRKLVESRNDFDGPLAGKNEEGEDVIVEVMEDCVLFTTMQDNGWMRLTYCYPDGTSEELYERD